MFSNRILCSLAFLHLRPTMPQRYEWNSHGRQHTTSRRWGPRRPGDRKTGAERSKRLRRRWTCAQRLINSAVRVARRSIKAGFKPSDRKPKPSLLKAGLSVSFNPLGSTMVVKGTIVEVWKSPPHSPSRFAKVLVVLRRQASDRKADKRLKLFVAVPPENVFF